MTAALIDALAFTSLWAASVAGAMCAAASLAMGVAPSFAVVGIAVSGTLVVYNIDRLRDIERDAATSPLRTAFISRHIRPIGALTGVAGVAAFTCTLLAGWRAAVLLAPALLLGLFHRRLKGIPFSKPAYITAAWLIVIVGLPAIAAPAEHILPVVVIFGLAIAANVIASNVRDRETATPRISPRVALRIARGAAAAGVAVAIIQPAVRPLVGIPACTLAALLRSDLTERYGLIVVDGALLAGALVGILALA